MSFEPGKVNDFLDIFNSSKERIRNYKGCTRLELLQDTFQTNIFFTYSYWETKEDLNNYRGSELFGSVWPRTKLLFNAKPEAWSVEQHTILT
jgi:heme-degrading monooxygenase HmoA